MVNAIECDLQIIVNYNQNPRYLQGKDKKQRFPPLEAAALGCGGSRFRTPYVYFIVYIYRPPPRQMSYSVSSAAPRAARHARRRRGQTATRFVFKVIIPTLQNNHTIKIKAAPEKGHLYLSLSGYWAGFQINAIRFIGPAEFRFEKRLPNN
jgi:hypothetical protein